MPNEVQNLLPSVSPTLFEDGACELTFDGQTTASIPHGDINTTATFASAIQTALEALSNIGIGNVSVAWSTDRAVVTFQGALANTNVPELTVSANTLKAKADTVSVTTTQNGSAGANEEQRLGAGETTTTGTISLEGNSTSATVDMSILISGGGAAGAAELQTALDTIWGSGNCTAAHVSGVVYSMTFGGSFANTNVPQMTLVNNTDGSPSINTETEGSSPQPQVVTVTLPDSPTEGTLNVTLDATTSSDFNYNDASPAAITDWTGGGSAANWTYTRDTNAANVTASGAEGSTPLRKDATITPSTATQGGAGGGSAAMYLMPPEISLCL